MSEERTDAHDEAVARVLIVDDSPDVVMMTTMILVAYGHEADGARSGAEAVERARAERYDVAVIDIAMPDMSGLELVDELRTLWGSGPALIALTGWGSQSMRRMALEAGFDFYCIKPLDGRKLAGIIDHAVRKAS